MARPVLRWVLTGGIGSGKTTVAGILRDLGITVVDADRIAHEMYEPGGEAFDAVAERWPAVLVDGRVDRRELADIVFSDRGQLAELEAMIHPKVGQRLRRIAAEAGDRDLVIEVSVPEALVRGHFDVVVVDAPDDVRIQRLQRRGMSEADARRRMQAQPPRTEWLHKADVVIDNGNGIDRLEEIVRRVLGRARAPDG
jgi:dephospho-CoA kinase